MSQSTKFFFIQPKIIGQFVAEIEFGMPSKECRNFGICRISPLRWGHKYQEGKSIAILSLLNNQTIELEFLKVFLTSYKKEKFLSKKTFLIEEDYEFISQEKDLNNFRILKGLHPITEKEDKIIVFCKTSEL